MDKKISVSKPIYRRTGYMGRGYKAWDVNVSGRMYRIINWISFDGTIQHTVVDDADRNTIYDSREAGWNANTQGYRNAMKFIKKVEEIKHE